MPEADGLFMAEPATLRVDRLEALEAVRTWRRVLDPGVGGWTAPAGEAMANPPGPVVK